MVDIALELAAVVLELAAVALELAATATQFVVFGSAGRTVGTELCSGPKSATS